MLNTWCTSSSYSVRFSIYRPSYRRYHASWSWTIESIFFFFLSCCRTINSRAKWICSSDLLSDVMIRSFIPPSISFEPQIDSICLRSCLRARWNLVESLVDGNEKVPSMEFLWLLAQIGSIYWFIYHFFFCLPLIGINNHHFESLFFLHFSLLRQLNGKRFFS